MNKRRLQVFVSSTFTDLVTERQAAVEAILKAGHIPAGMELFTAGSLSQLEVIKQWIKESDVYLLILGARYGSIEPSSGLSYTEIEFDYARDCGLPYFSVVQSDEGRKVKVKEVGESILERANVSKYDAFRHKVSSQMCAFFENTKDIKLAVLETLPQIALDPDLVGWIPASDATPSKGLIDELTQSLEENRRLKEEIKTLQKIKDLSQAPDIELRKIAELLIKETLTVPADVSKHPGGLKSSLLEIAITYAGELAAGVTNQAGVSEKEQFLRFKVAPKLVSFGLAEHAPVPSGALWMIFKLSKQGVKVLNWSRQNYVWKDVPRKSEPEASKAAPDPAKPAKGTPKAPQKKALPNRHPVV